MSHETRKVWYFYRPDLWKRVIYSASSEPRSEAREDVNEKKTADNIRRAQRSIEDLALCNPWEWFVTCTLSPKKYPNRLDLDGFRSDLMQLLRDERKRTGEQYAALLVPELHKNRDGWHMHGLLHGIPAADFKAFQLGSRLPQHIRGKLLAGEEVYDWPRYAERFGWVDVEPLRSRDAAARYITKYISKGLQEDITAAALDKGKHLYYCTRGLLRPVKVDETAARGGLPAAVPAGLVQEAGYEYEYGRVDWFRAPPASE